MNKKLLMLLVAMLLAGTNAFAEAVEIDGIWYNLVSKAKVAEVTSTPDNYIYIGAVNIPEKVTYNGVDYDVTSIGRAAFENSNVTSITIPNSVTSIGNHAFYECKDLTSVTFENDSQLTSIGRAAFYHCSSLTSVIIPNSVTSIGNQAFYLCDHLTSVTFENDSQLTSIGDYAFYQCSSLTSVIIPNSVTSIGRCAFYYAFDICYDLTSITIGSGVTSIGEFAFCHCSLKSIKVDAYNTTYDSRDNCNAIIETATNTLVFGIANTIIPNSVTSIGDSAFDSCERLTSVTFENDSQLTSIGEGAFYQCKDLTSITIPESVTSIGSYAFCDCLGLTSITIPNSVTNIGSWTFEGCASLTCITIGSGIESIEWRAFAYCPNLTDVYCYAENHPNTNNSPFEGSSINNATLHVPVASVKAYKTREPWSGFGTIAAIVDEDSSTPIPAGTYEKVDLKRTFAEGWNTICLPFGIDNIESVFGTGAKAYEFNNFTNGELKFSLVSSLTAGTPYVIYVPADITNYIVFDNTIIDDSNTESSYILKNGAYFRGTYAPVAAGEWTKNNSTDNIYGLTPDGKIRKAGSEASIYGLRAYFDIPVGAEVKGFVIEDGATGLTTINNGQWTMDNAIYNLAGQRLKKAQKGTNVVNGKKVLY